MGFATGPECVGKVARAIPDLNGLVAHHAADVNQRVRSIVKEVVHTVLNGGVTRVSGVYRQRKADEHHAGREGYDTGEQLGGRAPAEPAPPEQHEAHGPEHQQKQHREELVEEARTPAPPGRPTAGSGGVVGGS